MENKKTSVVWRDSLEHASVRTWISNQLVQQPKETACLLRDNHDRWVQVYGKPNKKDVSGNMYWYLSWLGLDLILMGGTNGTLIKYRPLEDAVSEEKAGLGIVSFYQHLLSQLF